MKLFPQDEIDKAANSECEYNHDWLRMYDDYFINHFKAGVEFAESKFEELAIEFVIYCDDNYEENSTNFKELFQQFIKDRNEV